MKFALKDVAEAVGGRVVGDGMTQVSGVASIEASGTDHLVFVDDETNFDIAMSSTAGSVIAGEFALTSSHRKPLIISAQPKLAFAKAAKLFADKVHAAPGIHPSALVHPTAKIDEEASIGPKVVISAGVEVGPSSTIGAGSFVGDHVRIGRECEIYSNVTIYAGATLGDRVIVHAGAVLGSDGFGYVRDQGSGRYEKFPQIGRLEIGDDVEIGANSTIDRGALDVTRIGRGTKIDNLVHLGHNCQIGEDVVIAAQSGLSGSVTVEDGAVIAGQVGIGEHARIKAGVVLGGQCGVLSNKTVRGSGVVFWGTPARPLRDYLKQLAKLATLTKKDER